MDRAHRIGQKRVVSVYRLITRHTLEEKIMSLQRFKLHTARTVISADNASLHTMATDQVMVFSSVAESGSGSTGSTCFWPPGSGS
jgi:TATA-binding protein-associated factor